MVTNRSPLKVSTAMLQAGSHALEDSRNLAHDPRTTVHLVFLAMIAESSWSPAIRRRPEKSTRLLHSPSKALASYRGTTAKEFEWRGFNCQDGKHYLCDGRKWIRLTDEQWLGANLLFEIEHHWHDVSPAIAMGYLKRKAFTLL